jgi:hypothetical protein
MLVPSGEIQKAVSPFLVPNMKLGRFMFMEVRGKFFCFCIELKYAMKAYGGVNL